MPTPSPRPPAIATCRCGPCPGCASSPAGGPAVKAATVTVTVLKVAPEELRHSLVVGQDVARAQDEAARKKYAPRRAVPKKPVKR